MKQLILILSLSFFLTELFSQSHPHTHYTVEDGLPSSEVYSAFQDSKGYMWFATDAGVSRFNGYEFQNFDASNGLTDNTVFLIREDHKGRIWFGTFNCQLSYFENDKIYPYKHNDKLGAVIKEKTALCSFEIDSSETLWMGFYNQGIFKCDKNGNISHLNNNEKGCDRTAKSYFVNDKIVVGISSVADNEKILISKRIRHKTQTCIEIITKLKKNKTSLFFDFNENYFISNFFIIKHAKDVLAINNIQSKQVSFTSSPAIINISLPNEIKKNKINSVFSDDYFLWFCSDKDGVYKCKLENNKISVLEHFFNNKAMSRVYRDSEKGLWFMTLNDGIYYMPSENFKLVPIGEKYNERTSSVAFDSVNKYIYVLLDNGNLNQINYKEGSFMNNLIFHSEHTNYPLHYNNYNNEILFGKPRDGITSFKDSKVNISALSTYNTGFKSIYVESDTIYKVNEYGFSIIINGKEKYLSYPKNKKMWSTSLIKTGNSIWIGTNDGIRIFKDSHLTNPFKANRMLSSAITSIEKLNNEVFLIGTKSYGVLIIKNDTIFEIIDEAKGLASNLVRKMHVDDQKEIWVITNKGLSRIKNVATKNRTIQNLDKRHGLPTAIINDITSYRNTVFLATTSGLIKFNKTNSGVNLTPPPVFITQFNVNSEERNIENIADLSYEENFINIHFEGLNYRSLGEVEYKYRMLGVDTNWISTPSRSIQYPTLQPNDYTFEVKAKNEDGIWSKEPTTISFTINPPLWLTWWFITIEIIFGIIIIYLVFRYREKQLVEKNKTARKITEAEKRMVELELKALRSQMNPHFIFNTLNSIQHYIALSDFRSTNKYITQFAKLIRTVLNLSEKNMITIQEEIDMLKLYMDLEKMRFEEQFSYEINVGKEIDSDYDDIPSMLIQPYVENAIWHGLMNKSEKGMIKIDVNIEGDHLCCKIEDNGIGRKKAAEIKAKRNIKQKSVGMSITKERLEIMNDNEVSVKTIDLEDDKGSSLGTKIIIRVPYNN